jgi:hypothetical protein
VGLLNFIGDGIHDVAGEYSELGAAFVARLGGRRVYTLLSLGEAYERGITGLRIGGGAVMVGLGLGLHTQVGSWSVDTEVFGRRMYFTDVYGAHLLATFRLALGVPLTGNLRLVFGPSFNGFFDFDQKFPKFAYGWKIALGSTDLKVWPGAFIGIRF